jgi:hypothetical protein
MHFLINLQSWITFDNWDFFIKRAHLTLAQNKEREKKILSPTSSNKRKGKLQVGKNGKRKCAPIPPKSGKLKQEKASQTLELLFCLATTLASWIFQNPMFYMTFF